RLDALADRYPRSSLRDDALWRAAHLLREMGRPDDAIERLRRILRTRKDALVTGSYNMLYLDDAQLLLGEIELDDLHDAARAADALLHSRRARPRRRDQVVHRLDNPRRALAARRSQRDVRPDRPGRLRQERRAQDRLRPAAPGRGPRRRRRRGRRARRRGPPP